MEKNTIDFPSSEALRKIKDADKDISTAFFFKNGKILVEDEEEKEVEEEKTIESFEKINSRAGIIDGIRVMTIQSANGRVDITQINDYFLTTVAVKEATNETLNKLTRVLAPSIPKKPEESTEIPKEHPTEMTPQTKNVEKPTAEIKEVERKPKIEIKPILPAEPTIPKEPNLPNTEFVEFTVDNMGRLDIISASQDVVRLDAITVGRWIELYGINKIHKIMIKAVNTGKGVACKFEEMKDSNDERRNVIMIPEMIQRILQIKKGTKVLIKPLLDSESSEKSSERPKIVLPEKKTFKREFQRSSLASQLIVEDLSSFGSLRANDRVCLDYSLVERWKEFYGQEVEEVQINDILLGKSVVCKFKMIKDSKFEGKGRIQIPKAIREQLSVKEGSLITIKPVVKPVK